MKKSMIIAPVLVLVFGLFILGDGIWLITDSHIPMGVIAILVACFILLGAYGGFLRLYLFKKGEKTEKKEQSVEDEKIKKE